MAVVPLVFLSLELSHGVFVVGKKGLLPCSQFLLIPIAITRYILLLLGLMLLLLLVAEELVEELELRRHAQCERQQHK